MRKNKIFLTFIFLIVFNSIALGLPHYYNSTFNINLDIPESWNVKTNTGNSVLTLINIDNISQINIYVIPFAEPITVNRLQQLFIDSNYENWISLGERKGTEKENERARVDESSIALFSKKTVNENMEFEKTIAGAYFFLKEQRGYVVSISTKQENWKIIKDSFDGLINSFWIGKGKRLLPEKTIAANNSTKTSDTINLATLKKDWEFNMAQIDLKKDFTFFAPIVSLENVFLNIDNYLYCLSVKDGLLNWYHKVLGQIDNKLLYYQDLLYFINKNEKNYLYGLFAQGGHVLFKQTLDDAIFSDPVAYNGAIYIIDGKKLKSLSADDGSLYWTNTMEYDPSFTPIITTKALVAIQKNNSLTKINQRNGEILWAVTLDAKPLIKPIVQDKNVIVLQQINNELIISAFNFENGSLNWSNTLNNILKILSSPKTISEKLLIFAEIETEPTNDALIILDSNTGTINAELKIAKAKNYLFSEILVYDQALFLLRKELSDEEINNYFLVKLNIPNGDTTEALLFSGPNNIIASLKFTSNFLFIAKETDTLNLTSYILR